MRLMKVASVCIVEMPALDSLYISGGNVLINFADDKNSSV